MKTNKIILYISMMIVILGLIFLNGFFLTKQDAYRKDYFRFSLPLLLSSYLVNVLIGVVVGGEHFFKNINKVGNWSMDYRKFFILLLPFLILSFTNVILYNLGHYISMPVINLLTGYNDQYPWIFQILFGYFLITSFYKKGFIVEK